MVINSVAFHSIFLFLIFSYFYSSSTFYIFVIFTPLFLLAADHQFGISFCDLTLGSHFEIIRILRFTNQIWKLVAHLASHNQPIIKLGFS
jgi:hypothetical protein